MEPTFKITNYVDMRRAQETISQLNILKNKHNTTNDIKTKLNAAKHITIKQITTKHITTKHVE